MKKMKGEEQGKGFNEDNVVTKTGTYTSIQYMGQFFLAGWRIPLSGASGKDGQGGTRDE